MELADATADAGTDTAAAAGGTATATTTISAVPPAPSGELALLMAQTGMSEADARALWRDMGMGDPDALQVRYSTNCPAWKMEESHQPHVQARQPPPIDTPQVRYSTTSNCPAWNRTTSLTSRPTNPLPSTPTRCVIRLVD